MYFKNTDLLKLQTFSQEQNCTDAESHDVSVADNISFISSSDL